MSSEVTVFSYSDWAGVKETRKSVKREGRARGTTPFGSANQKPEKEPYAAALGASEAKGVQSMICELGFAVKPVLIIEAKATEHILRRHGIGKMKTHRRDAIVIAR